MRRQAGEPCRQLRFGSGRRCCGSTPCLR